MLLSNRNRYLFVHLAKTGGTSIRAALGRQRWLDPYYWPSLFCHRVSKMCGHRIGCKIPRHAPIVVAKEMLPPQMFARLFKFGFVRNPWDRMVSAYYHFQHERQDLLRAHQLVDFPAFAAWLLKAPLMEFSRPTLVQALRRPQRDYLVDLDNSLLVDFVGRYENLLGDYRTIVRKLQMTELSLPHKRRGKRHRDYRSHYTDETAEMVGEHFKVDLTTFSYRFDPPKSVDPLPRIHGGGALNRCRVATSSLHSK